MVIKAREKLYEEAYMNKFVRDVVITLILLYAWCLIWEWLEILIYGHPENRLVDNIMTIILIPILFIAVSKW